MDSNQNNETGKSAIDNIVGNEQSILPADIPQPAPLENQSPPAEIMPLQTQRPMEVHHHGHVHEKKKWKEYLFQFLMLFLAVFCGFLAEYQLEHKIEKDREKQFMQTMAEDLKSDSAELSNLIRRRKSRIRQLDTLFNIIANDEYLKEGRRVYELY